MSQNLASIGAFKPEPLSLEDCLIELEKYGEPMLSKMDKGWYSKVEVFVTGEGVKFDVKSRFDCKTPKDAANECYGRLLKALARIKNGET